MAAGIPSALKSAGKSPASTDSKTIVFISYAREDEDFVRKLNDALDASGRKPWVDWRDIPKTANFMTEIRQGIEQSHTFVFVISPDSATSAVCRNECEYAIQLRKRLAPIVRRKLDDDKVLLPALSQVNWIFFTDADDFPNRFGELTSAIDTDLEWVRTGSRLLVRALEWERHNKNRSYTLQGEDLAEAERWSDAASRSTDGERKRTELQTQYVRASREVADRRRRTALSVVTGFCIVAIVLAAVAWWQSGVARNQRDIAQNRTRIAQSRQLASQAKELSSERLDLAFLLSAEAYDQAPTLEACDTLARLLEERPGLRTVLATYAGAAGYSDAPPNAAPSTQAGNEKLIVSLAFARDGESLISLNNDGDIQSWDLNKLSRQGPAHNGEGRGMDSLLSSSGRVVAEVTTSGAVVLSNIGGHPIATIAGATGPGSTNPGMSALALSENDALLVTGSGDGVIEIRDGHTGKPIGPPLTPSNRSATNPNLFSSVTELKLSADASTLVSWTYKEDPVLWDLRTRRKQVLKPGFSATPAALSPDGKSLALWSDDGNVYQWNLADPKPKKLDRPDTTWSGRMVFSPDGKYLATGSSNGSVTIWQGSELVIGPAKAHAGRVTALRFSHDSKRLATGDEFGAIFLWNAPGEGRTWSLDPHASPAADLILSEIQWSDGVEGDISPDSQTVAAVAREGVIRIAKLVGGIGGEVKDLPTGGLLARSVAFSADGKRVAGGCKGGAVAVWDVQSPQSAPSIVRPAEAGARPVTVVAFDPTGKLLACGTDEGSITLCDLASMKMQSAPFIPPPSPAVTNLSLHFTKDGKQLAVCADGNATIWDIESHKIVFQTPGNLESFPRESRATTFDPDFRLLGASGPRTVAIWDRSTGKRIAQIDKPRPPMSGWGEDTTTTIAIAPGGSLLAWRDFQYGIYVADPRGTKLLGNPLHQGRAGQADGLVGLMFSPDGSWLLIPYFGRMYRWDANPASWQATARRIANRSLTPDERRRYIEINLDTETSYTNSTR